MKYYLFKYHDNWADEIDIDGYAIMNEKKKNKFEKSINHIKENNTGIYFYIGTNEEIDHATIPDDLYDFVEISSDEYKTLKKLNITTMGFADSFIENVISFEDNTDQLDE